MDIDLDIGLLPMKPVLLVADGANAVPRRLLQIVCADMLGSADLAGQDDSVGRHQGLDGDPRLGLGGEIEIDDRKTYNQ